MSFSSKVKREIFKHIGPRHCRIAELSAIIDSCGKFAPVFEIKTENGLVRAKFEKFTSMDFNRNDDNWLAKMMFACGPANGRPVGATKSECCKKAYVRGAYLSAGTMANPAGAYHMEFAVSPGAIAHITEIFAFFGLAPKIHRRKSQQILYFKEAEQIATVLNIIGAHVALMEFENCRVGKDVNNAINRAANAEAANADKVVAASAKQSRDILDIQNLVGLSVLDDALAQVAQIRMDNPLLSLEGIGKKLDPPISKSGVNHRLKKIAQIAEMYRRQHVKAQFKTEV
ncbi:MAG: DNA-binding protein WhiA [Clostridiales bacterium]|jgi:DNA-binding transcriptional regulator WhiA|nr:DNA-binding protein WhiA [Clostridiales bacterium]